MKLTNKHGLPEVFVRAMERDPYSSGDADISTTRLINPPMMVTLMRRHADDLVEDVADGMWRLLGQCVHGVLERAAPEGTIAEKRYFADVNGWKVSGQVDLIDGRILADYKMTSTFTVIYGSRNTEWEQQANINRWLAHKNGINVERAENYLILRDWQASKAKQGGRYPKIPFVTVPLELWPIEKAESYVLERVKLHQVASKMEDGLLTPCTAEERWERNGVSIRCDSYCSASSVCGFYKQLSKKAG